MKCRDCLDDDYTIHHVWAISHRFQMGPFPPIQLGKIKQFVIGRGKGTEVSMLSKWERSDKRNNSNIKHPIGSENRRITSQREDKSKCFLNILCNYESSRTMLFKKIKSVAYSSQGSYTGQLDFCN